MTYLVRTARADHKSGQLVWIEQEVPYVSWVHASVAYCDHMLRGNRAQIIHVRPDGGRHIVQSHRWPT